MGEYRGSLLNDFFHPHPVHVITSTLGSALLHVTSENVMVLVRRGQL